PPRFHREAAATARSARPGRGADPAAHLRLPQRLLAALPGRDRAGRQGTRTLQPDARRRPSRAAAQHAVPREHHRDRDPRRAGAAAGRLGRLAARCRRPRRVPAAHRRGRHPGKGSPPRPHRQHARGRTRMNLPTPAHAADSPQALTELNQWLGARRAEERLEWALHTLPGEHVLSSSFGAQAAVSLHMASSQRADLPVIVIDTGYLFPETYRFIDEMSERLSLNLKVYRPQIGVAWMEARMGRIWEEGVDGITRYNRLRKVEP